MTKLQHSTMINAMSIPQVQVYVAIRSPAPPPSPPGLRRCRVSSERLSVTGISYCTVATLGLCWQIKVVGVHGSHAQHASCWASSYYGRYVRPGVTSFSRRHRISSQPPS